MTTQDFSSASLALILLLASPVRAQKSKHDEKKVTDYFPLQVGYSWTYRNNESGGYTIKVLSEEPHEGAPPRYVVEFLSGVKILRTFSKTLQSVLCYTETYSEHEGLQATYDPPRPELPNPLAVGQKWEWSGKDPTQVEYRESSRAVGMDTVKVAAGTFRTIKVVTEITGGSATKVRTNWYADGVGLVKTTTEAGPMKYGSELTDYSFKKK